MAHFANLNSIIRGESIGVCAQRAAERKANKLARCAAYLDQLVTGRVVVTRANKEGKGTHKRTIDASPAHTLELLRKALNAGATADDIRHVQQRTNEEKEGRYTFIAQRFEWANAKDAILAEFDDEHRVDASIVLGLNEPSEEEVEAAVTTEPKLGTDTVEPVAATDAVVDEAIAAEPVAKVARRRNRKAS